MQSIAALQPSLTYGMPQTTRYVTGHDSRGLSITVPTPPLQYLDRGRYAISRAYALEKVPAPLTNGQDLDAYLSPDCESYQTSYANGGSQPVVPGGVNFLQGDFGPSATTPMHRTMSVDFVVLVQGELVLELDSGEKTHLKPGDSVIQRATVHRWINPSPDYPARFIATTVACEPLIVAGQRLDQMPRKPRACIPCHERKVRCDATEVAIPCTRCINSGRVEVCKLMPTPERLRGTKRKRMAGPRDHTLQQEEDASQCQTAGQETLNDDTTASFNDTSQPTHSQTNGIIETSANPLHVPPGQITDPANDRVIQPPPPPFQSPYSSSPSQESEGVGEDESQLQICREMAEWNAGFPVAAPTSSSPGKGREVIEYHGGVNSVTILSQALRRAPPKRLVKIILRDPTPKPGQQLELDGLDDADNQYLQRKGAFDLPPADVCDQLLHLYFQCVYIYAPVLDRVQFLREYRTQTHSLFILQSILASVMPYAPASLIRDAGFDDHQSAQKAFIDRARLLYDVGVERSQLRMLQGALILSHLHVSLYTEKDYRYWLSNATRIATKMGLHKDEVARSLDPSWSRLLRRIWWVLYNRDALLVFNGLDNIQRIHETDFDTSELTLEDWEDGDIPADFTSILPPVTLLQKHFLIESCKLSLMSVYFMRTIKRPQSGSENVMNELEEQMFRWRQCLPDELKSVSAPKWDVTNVWVFVLNARSYISECIMFRMMLDAFKLEDEDLLNHIQQKLYTAMLEVDTAIDRILMHNLTSYCPLFLYQCAAMVLALHIEKALRQSSLNTHEKLLTSLRIHTNLEFLRRISKSWSPMVWALQMFEVVVQRIGLSVALPERAAFPPGSQDLFNLPSCDGQVNNLPAPSHTIPVGNQSLNDLPLGLANEFMLNVSPTELDLPFGFMGMENFFQEVLPTAEECN
ncbi:hypothetical protein FE257_008059 [Aspergillus nanangensis]|uniref:Zn(2)-C6 fungal-type domain-containing protein n=1 Tax=Aspergillus nanangensis TaxID=2582783 RepID=A0AAD4CP15_ASPNN|nr:hypothetical protein FE257_008059 [Aspergillus nanangensis]